MSSPSTESFDSTEEDVRPLPVTYTLYLVVEDEEFKNWDDKNHRHYKFTMCSPDSEANAGFEIKTEEAACIHQQRPRVFGSAIGRDCTREFSSGDFPISKTDIYQSSTMVGCSLLALIKLR